MNKDINGRSYNRGLIVTILIIGTFLIVLNQTVLATALPRLMTTFNVNASTIQWLTTGFLLVNGIVIPVSAWASTRFNTKWLWISTMTIFGIGTILCWIAPNFGVLLFARIIQAIGAGIAMPLLQTILFTIFPINERGSAIGLMGIAVGAGPAFGPVYAGWVIGAGSWRDIFGIMIPFIIIIIILSLFYMRPLIQTNAQRLDIASFAMSCLGFGPLLYGFSIAGTDGWKSATVLISLIVGIIFVILFGIHQFKLAVPFLNLNVFKFNQFTISVFLGSIAMMILTSAELVLPMYLQIVRGQSALESGLMILPGAILLAVLNPITGKIVDKIGGHGLAIYGMICITIGTLPFCVLKTGTSLLSIVIIYAISMIGVAMVLMPITTIGMNSLTQDLIPHGTAVNNMVRQIFSSIGSALMISVMAIVTASQMPNQNLVVMGKTAKFAHLKILADLSGYRAAFMLMTVFCIISLVLSFFVKKPTKN